MAHHYSLVNRFKYDIISAFIERVIMAEIKTDKRASGPLDQDQTDVVSSVISKALDMASSWRSIFDPMATT